MILLFQHTSAARAEISFFYFVPSDFVAVFARAFFFIMILFAGFSAGINMAVIIFVICNFRCNGCSGRGDCWYSRL